MRLGALVLLIIAVCASPPARAADIVNGWSSSATISSLLSHETQTLFMLSGVANGCGHSNYWVLVLDDSARSKIKHSALIAAQRTGATVRLRCENSTVTDLEVF
jgi:hypothetical protein